MNYAKGSNSEFEDAYKAEYGQEYPNGFSWATMHSKDRRLRPAGC